MKVAAAHGFCLVIALAIGHVHAKVGVLVTKNSSIYKAPVAGLKSVLGADVVVLDMKASASTGKAHCKALTDQGCTPIVAVGKPAAKIAVSAVSGTPIVYCMVMNPAGSGIKGSSVTGVTLDIPMSKQFEGFKSVVPNLKTIGIVYSDDVGAKLVKEMKSAAGKTGVTLAEKKVASDAEVPNAIRSLKGNIDGLYLPPDRTVAKHDAFQFIALFTFENNVPFMAPTSRFVKKGALVALMIDYEEVGKQTAQMVKKILGGASPSSMPVEPPETTILVLNQKTAETIGINIPPSLTSTSKIIK